MQPSPILMDMTLDHLMLNIDFQNTLNYKRGHPIPALGSPSLSTSLLCVYCHLSFLIFGEEIVHLALSATATTFVEPSERFEDARESC